MVKIWKETPEQTREQDVWKLATDESQKEMEGHWEEDHWAGHQKDGVNAGSPSQKGGP